MQNWSMQQKGTKLLRHPFPKARLTDSFTDLTVLTGRKTVLGSASFRKVCAATQNVYNTLGQEVSFNTRGVIVQAA